MVCHNESWVSQGVQEFWVHGPTRAFGLLVIINNQTIKTQDWIKGWAFGLLVIINNQTIKTQDSRAMPWPSRLDQGMSYKSPILAGQCPDLLSTEVDVFYILIVL